MNTMQTESESKPRIGQTRRNKWHNLEVYHACIDCGKERWGQIKPSGQPKSERCRTCARRIIMTGLKGERCRAWRGGRSTNGRGYIIMALQPDDFFYPMAQKGRDGKGTYVLEHRLVVAKALGRCLQPWEHVHHKGDKYPRGSIENRQDNRYPLNLELTTRGDHMQEHDKGYRDGYQKGYSDGRSRRIKDLEMEINALKHSSG